MTFGSLGMSRPGELTAFNWPRRRPGWGQREEGCGGGLRSGAGLGGL